MPENKYIWNNNLPCNSTWQILTNKKYTAQSNVAFKDAGSITMKNLKYWPATGGSEYIKIGAFNAITFEFLDALYKNWHVKRKSNIHPISNSLISKIFMELFSNSKTTFVDIAYMVDSLFIIELKKDES